MYVTKDADDKILIELCNYVILYTVDDNTWVKTHGQPTKMSFDVK